MITQLLDISIVLNLSLAFFNLIPIGPLDGQHMLARLLPRDTSIRFSLWNAQYGGLVLMGAIIADQLFKLNLLRTIILTPVSLVYSVIM